MASLLLPSFATSHQPTQGTCPLCGCPGAGHRLRRGGGRCSLLWGAGRIQFGLRLPPFTRPRPTDGEQAALRPAGGGPFHPTHPGLLECSFTLRAPWHRHHSHPAGVLEHPRALPGAKVREARPRLTLALEADHFKSAIAENSFVNCMQLICILLFYVNSQSN